MRHTLSVLVENRSGELSRIVGLFTARGYNIESLTVTATLDPRVARITLVTDGEDRTIEQIVKRVEKQVRVLEVQDVTRLPSIERELALVQVKTEAGPALSAILSLISKNRVKLVDTTGDLVTIEATGDQAEIAEIIRLLAPLGIHEMVRSGAVALPAPGPHAADLSTSNRDPVLKVN